MDTERRETLTPSARPVILFVGNDSAFAYLFRRYAQRSGYSFHSVPLVPPTVDICAMQPAAVWLPSLETLEAFQPLKSTLTNFNIPVVVCASVADEARARELGADYCLLHPVTYGDFLNALAATGAAPADTETKAPERRT